MRIVLQIGTILCMEWLAAVRSRLLAVGIGIAVAAVIFSILTADVAIFAHQRLIVDMALAAASLVAIASGIALVMVSFAGEINNQTATVILSHPIFRATWLVGKFFGIWLALSSMQAVIVLASALTLKLYSGQVPLAFIQAALMLPIEAGVVVAIAFLFASTASQALASAYTVATVCAGQLSQDLLVLAGRQSSIFGKSLCDACFALLPDMAQLSFRTLAANDVLVEAQVFFAAMGYGVLYAATCLGLAALILSRRRAL